jgi:hypothetical protein
MILPGKYDEIAGKGLLSYGQKRARGSIMITKNSVRLNPKIAWQGKGALTMFVVHTVNQLEEAVRVGAGEILITGGLASNVHEAYLLKSCTDQESPTSDEPMHLQAHDTTGWGLTSLLVIMGEYALLDSRLDNQSPSAVLQRTNQH